MRCLRKNKMKLRNKLILYYVTLTIVFISIIGISVNMSIRYYGLKTVEKQLIKQVISSLDYIKQTLYIQDKFDDRISISLAKKITEELSSGNRDIRIYDKSLYLLSAHIDGIKQEAFEIETVESNLNNAVNGDFSYSSDGQDIYFAAPIIFRGNLIGVLEVMYPLDLLNEILLKTTYVLIIAGVVFSIGITILSFYIAQRTVKPINELVEVADKYSKKKFVKINIDGPYEIDILSKSLEIMGENIQEYINRQNQFVSNVSHELKTPLTVIKGYSDYLIHEVKGNKDLQKAVFHLNNETKRLTKLVNELLILSRIQSENEIYNIEEVNLTKLVNSIITAIKVRIDREEISLVTKLVDDIYIQGDKSKISQVILNIIDNAIKYSNKLKEVEVFLSREEDNAVLSVKDKGIGIPESDIHKVFDRFYRASNTKGFKGTGLGLAIGKEIIEKHNGYIKIKARRGEGTTVKVVLPISKKLLQD